MFQKWWRREVEKGKIWRQRRKLPGYDHFLTKDSARDEEAPLLGSPVLFLLYAPSKLILFAIVCFVAVIGAIAMFPIILAEKAKEGLDSLRRPNRRDDS